MYHVIVRRKIRNAFAALSRGDAPALLAQMSPTVHHSFPGEHALGGQRHTRVDVGAWLARLFRLFPGLDFHIHALAVDGPPWNTIIGVEWTDTGTLPDGSPYSNAGAHILRLRWGKLTGFHAYLHDAAEAADALARLAAHGVSEAGEPPILTTATTPASTTACRSLRDQPSQTTPQGQCRFAHQRRVHRLMR